MKEQNWRDFLRMKVFVRPYACQLGLMIVIGLAGSALGLVQPYLSKYLVDNALLRRDVHALMISAVLMFAATVAGSILSYVSGYGYMRVSASMLLDMRLKVYTHLHALSPRFYARARLGDLVSRLNGDVAEVQRISSDFFLTTLTNALFIAGSLGMMIWLSWKLFFVGIVLIPFSIALFRFFQIRMNLLARELRERSAAIGTLFVETLLGVRLVACFNSSEYESERFRSRNDSFVSTLMRFQSTSMLGRTVPGTLLTAATTAVFVYGGQQIIAGQMTMGTLVAFMAYHSRLLSPVQSLLGLSASLSSAKVSLSRVLELLDAPIEVTEQPDAVAVSAVHRSIEFRDVTLRHDGRAVLDDVSFEIPAGMFSVIVGPSGGGKSTIADLMVRLLDPDAGAVMIDGLDLKRTRLSDLRRTVVLIDQSPYLFHGTLYENIAYAKPFVGRVAVEQAAHAAGLTELLRGLPEGLNTVAGERGLTLSAGERQRVAIARAFLAKPEVLILDEPSAALDAACERELVDNLRWAFAGKTLIAITHKPALASVADHILYIKDGRVVEAVSV
ncbi:MAG: ABC transporter [Acidobacteria bacterium 13_1_20CM_2_57_8]|nr:MAG: ABC transporter [Acidobacteria bacterium 13_1_20CM_2_57_8]